MTPEQLFRKACPLEQQGNSSSPDLLFVEIFKSLCSFMPEIRLPVEQITVADLAGKHLLSNKISDEFCVHEILHI